MTTAATATATALDTLSFDADVALTSAAAKRAQLAAAQANVMVATGIMCWEIGRVHRASARLAQALSDACIETPEQRMVLAEAARTLAGTVRALDASIARMRARRIDELIPIFGTRLVVKADALAELVEDIAETAALGASEAFARAVEHELDTIEPTQRRYA